MTQTSRLRSRTESRYRLAVGIDPGTRTGLAVATPDSDPDAIRMPPVGYRWQEIQTLQLHHALVYVRKLVLEAHQDPEATGSVLVVVEDARQIGGPAHQKLGAGSVRRDSAIWEEFLQDLAREVPELEFRFVRPSVRGLRKLDSRTLQAYTGCVISGSQHARDAVGLLFPHL
jgi:hypothetical protein